MDVLSFLYQIYLCYITRLPLYCGVGSSPIHWQKFDSFVPPFFIYNPAPLLYLPFTPPPHSFQLNLLPFFYSLNPFSLLPCSSNILQQPFSFSPSYSASLTHPNLQFFNPPSSTSFSSSLLLSLLPPPSVILPSLFFLLLFNINTPANYSLATPCHPFFSYAPSAKELGLVG